LQQDSRALRTYVLHPVDDFHDLFAPAVLPRRELRHRLAVPRDDHGLAPLERAAGGNVGLGFVALDLVIREVRSRRDLEQHPIRRDRQVRSSSG
jgi:hypothetical protein